MSKSIWFYFRNIRENIAVPERDPNDMSTYLRLSQRANALTIILRSDDQLCASTTTYQAKNGNPTLYYKPKR